MDEAVLVVVRPTGKAIQQLAREALQQPETIWGELDGGIPLTVTAEATLDLARAGDLQSLRGDLPGLSFAVRAFAESGDAVAALELFGRAWRAWMMEGALAEAAAAAAVALRNAAPSNAGVWRVRALYGDGVIAFRQGDRERSLARNEEALLLARDLKDVRGECEALTGLARVALRDGDYQKVVDLASEGRRLARDAGDREAEAAPLHLHAAGVRLQGDHARARDLYLESLDLNTALGSSAWIAMEHHNLGWVELHLGDADAAESRFSARAATGEADAYGKAWSELNRAGVAIVRGHHDEAVSRFQTGMQILKETQLEPDPDDQAELEWLAGQLGYAVSGN